MLCSLHHVTCEFNWVLDAVDTNHAACFEVHTVHDEGVHFNIPVLVEHRPSPSVKHWVYLHGFNCSLVGWTQQQA